MIDSTLQLSHDSSSSTYICRCDIGWRLHRCSYIGTSPWYSTTKARFEYHKTLILLCLAFCFVFYTRTISKSFTRRSALFGKNPQLFRTFFKLLKGTVKVWRNSLKSFAFQEFDEYPETIIFFLFFEVSRKKMWKAGHRWPRVLELMSQLAPVFVSAFTSFTFARTSHFEPTVMQSLELDASNRLYSAPVLALFFVPSSFHRMLPLACSMLPLKRLCHAPAEFTSL